MTLRIHLTLAATLLALDASAGQAQLRPGRASELGWLAGCWERRAGTLLIEEQWLAPRAGTLLGLSRTTRADSLIEYEFLRIQERDGRLVLTAAPSRQAPAEFIAQSATDDEVMFENASHDFPQRIRYRKAGADSLLARIEGIRGGQPRGVDFPYVRTTCPSGEPPR